jgi:hypothetical protein
MITYSRTTLNSELSRVETNDCSVIALANAFDISYDESHEICKTELYRKNRKGVLTYHLIDFLDKCQVNGKKATEIKYEPVQIQRTIRQMRNYWYTEEKITYTDTINLYTKRGTFIKQYDKGTYIINIKGHVFVVKDSVVFGNFDDYSRLKKIVIFAYKIESI